MLLNISFMKAFQKVILLLLISLFSSNCGYNNMTRLDEEVSAQWAEVLNQYKRRSDLIPNLVKTVQAYANQEKEIFTAVAQARSKTGSIQATPELVNDEAAMTAFIAAQNQMGGALSRLMMVAENYPDLKANQNFRDLQVQLEGTENRITVARNRYIESVKNYNTEIRMFPGNITASIFSFDRKAQFTVENEKAIQDAPTVSFE